MIMKHELPKLPYANDALAQVLGEATLNFHYGKHERSYIDNLNKLIAGTEYENQTLEEIIRSSEGGIFNNAAQAWNHIFYFFTLSPDGKVAPEGSLRQAIERDFVSVEAFKEKFEAAGLSLFGSGWIWLVADVSGKLSIVQGKNAETPLTTPGMRPLLCFDVWEHAYYLDYQNRRAEYLHRMWEIIDWDVVEQRFEF